MSRAGRHVAITVLLIVASAVTMSASTSNDSPVFARSDPERRNPSAASMAHSAVTDAVPVGYDFPLAVGYGKETQGKPGVAYDGENFLAVWVDLGTDNIYGARVSPTGAVLDTEPIPISVDDNDLTRQPSVAFDGENYFVSWCATRSGNDELYGARVTPAGEVLDPDGLQLTTGGNALNRMPGIAFDGTNYLIVWRTPTTKIRAARVTPDGVNLDAPAGFLIADVGVSKYPAVAFDGTNYMVVWYKDGGTTDYDIYGARVQTDGTVLDPEGFVVCDAPMSQTYPTVAYNGQDYFVAWYDYRPDDDSLVGSAYGARVSTAGAVLDTPAFRIADRVRGGIPVQVTYTGADWLVVYSEAKGEGGNAANLRATDVYGFEIASDGQIVNQQGIPISPSFGHQFAPIIGCGDGQCLVAWGDIFREGDGAVYGHVLDVQAAASARVASQAEEQSNIVQDLSWEQETIAGPYVSSGLGLDADDAYAFGDDVYHHDGTVWSTAYVDAVRGYGSWHLGGDQIWAGGWCRGIAKYADGSWSRDGCWTSTYDNGIVTGLWGIASNEMWATCDRGDLLLDDESWGWDTVTTTTSVDLWDIWGVSHDDIYAVGGRGVILHYDGTTWTPMSDVPTDQALNAVWGSGPEDVFAAGDWGTILHYDGASWSVQSSGTLEHLFDLWGTDGQNVYAAGFDGTFLTYDGSGWTPENIGSDQDLFAVWGAVDDVEGTLTVWTAGRGDTVFKTTMTAPPLPEIEVSGNGQLIQNRDDTPDPADGTDFGTNAVGGTPITHIFTITNSGTANLMLGDEPRVDVIGENPGDFSVTLQPGSPVLSTTGVTTFEVGFVPSDVGLREARVIFAHNDMDETPYTFAVQGTGTDDTTVGFSGAPYSVHEGIGNAVVTATLNAASSDTVTVTYGTGDGTATLADNDYSSASGQLVFAPGETTKTFDVTIVDDSRDEPAAETINLYLSDAINSGGTPTSTTLSIEDDDSPPTVAFAHTALSATEAVGTLTVPVTLSAVSGMTVTVEVGTSSGTATAGEDFITSSGTLVFPPGMTSQALSVAIVDDQVEEGDETVLLALSDAQNAVIGDDHTAVLSITDGFKIHLPLVIRGSQ